MKAPKPTGSVEIRRYYAPDDARLTAACRIVLGLPETDEGGRLFFSRAAEIPAGAEPVAPPQAEKAA